MAGRLRAVHVALARRYQQSAAIQNADFIVANLSTEPLPSEDRQLDLICSGRGPTAHLRDAARILRSGGLAVGLHTGDAERILDRVKGAGLHLVETRKFKGVEILPTKQDLALYLSRIPGFPDYTQPELGSELDRVADERKCDRGYAVDRWWLLWVARKS